MTQTQVATDSEIDRPNYAHIEAGRRKGTPAQLRAIATALGVPVLSIATLPADDGRTQAA